MRATSTPNFVHSTRISITGTLIAVAVAFWGQGVSSLLDKYNSHVPPNAPMEQYFPMAMHFGMMAAFLIAVLCVAWWYDNFIYRIRSRNSGATAAMDVLVAAMIILATQMLSSTSWRHWLLLNIIAALGSLLLAARFLAAKRLHFETYWERRALLYGGLAALSVAAAACYGIWSLSSQQWPTSTETPTIPPPGMQVLTIGLTIAIAITGASFRPMAIGRRASEARDAQTQLRQGINGLEAVRKYATDRPNLSSHLAKVAERVAQKNAAALEWFANPEAQGDQDVRAAAEIKARYEQVISRVHSSQDEDGQAWILELSAVLRNGEKYSAIPMDRCSSTWVRLTHFLDDIADTYCTALVVKRVSRAARRHKSPHADRGVNEHGLFRKIYRAPVRRLLGRRAWLRFDDRFVQLCTCVAALPSPHCSGECHRHAIAFALNNIAMGGVLASGRLTSREDAAIRAFYLARVDMYVVTKVSSDKRPYYVMSSKASQELFCALETDTPAAVRIEAVARNMLLMPYIYMHNSAIEVAADELGAREDAELAKCLAGISGAVGTWRSHLDENTQSNITAIADCLQAAMPDATAAALCQSVRKAWDGFRHGGLAPAASAES